MLTRRNLLAALVAALALGVEGAALAARRKRKAAPVKRRRRAAPRRRATPTPPFVQRDGTGFTFDGAPYRYVGANLWYGAYLGAPGRTGNRDRLARELDRLEALGVTNLRILAASEESPLRHSVKPAFQAPDGSGNPDLLAGLDFLLAEMAKRDMKAVLYLTNFWEWSGGMMTYLAWVNGSYIDMGDPAHPWPEFPNATAAFYADMPAVTRYHSWVRSMVQRVNSVTGTAYRNDPTIMAWQLANEPRPGGDAVTAERMRPAYYAWARTTARLIRALDANHLISTGSEGLKGSADSVDIYRTLHASPEFDYLTAHIWPQNWGWIDPTDLPGTGQKGLDLARAYLSDHVGYATDLGKPLVIEEFGWPRDRGGYEAIEPTTGRDAYYKMIYGAVEASVAAGGPLAGTNFWAWNGEGRAARADHEWKVGDPLLGDPPHEPQGWYGVFDTDASTLALIEAHAAALEMSAEGADDVA